MRKIMLLILALSLYPLFAQESRSVQAVLQDRLLQLEAERDRSERALLELQAETRPVIEELTREKTRLENRLEQVQRESLLLDSAQTNATRAGERAEEELEAVRLELETVREQLLSEQREFAETLNQLRTEQQRMVTEHTGERADLEAGQTALQERLEALMDQMAGTEQAAESLRAGKEALEREARDIEGLNRQLVTDLQEAQRRETLANAQLMAMQSRVEQLETSLQEALEQRSRAEQERDQMAQRVHALEIELSDLRESSVPRAELEKLQQSLDASLAGNRELQAALEQERARPDFTEDLVRTERERDLLDAQLKTLETRLQEAREHAGREEERRHQVSAANASLTDHIAGLETSLRDLQEGREQQSEEIHALQTRQEQLRADLMAMTEQFEAASLERGLYETLQVDFLSVQSELETRKELTAEQAEAIEDLQRALGASMQEVERSRRELEALQSGDSSLRSVAEQRDRLEAARENSRKDMRILANHIQTLRLELQQQRERQKVSDEQRQLLLNRIRDLESGSANP